MYKGQLKRYTRKTNTKNESSLSNSSKVITKIIFVKYVKDQGLGHLVEHVFIIRKCLSYKMNIMSNKRTVSIGLHVICNFSIFTKVG